MLLWQLIQVLLILATATVVAAELELPASAAAELWQDNIVIDKISTTDSVIPNKVAVLFKKFFHS
jgi:hypothetical protein